MTDIEKQLLDLLSRLTIMNTKLVTDLSRQHNELVEKVLPLLPGEQPVIFQIAKTEQLSAAVAELSAALEQALRAIESPKS
jgi:hypothetical protein